MKEKKLSPFRSTLIQSLRPICLEDVVFFKSWNAKEKEISPVSVPLDIISAKKTTSLLVHKISPNDTSDEIAEASIPLYVRPRYIHNLDDWLLLLKALSEFLDAIYIPLSGCIINIVLLLVVIVGLITRNSWLLMVIVPLVLKLLVPGIYPKK